MNTVISYTYYSQFSPSEKSKTSDISYLGYLMVSEASLPPIRSSCPWDPIRVLERNGAKSTKISLSRGDTEPRAFSSLSVSDSVCSPTTGGRLARASGIRWGICSSSRGLCSLFVTDMAWIGRLASALLPSSSLFSASISTGRLDCSSLERSWELFSWICPFCMGSLTFSSVTLSERKHIHNCSISNTPWK